MQKLNVVLDFGDIQREVGTLVLDQRIVHFAFAEKFLAQPLPLSPFKLPVQPGVFVHSDSYFMGLHGVFADSLPDGWGMLLMDRYFQQRVQYPTVLDRLAYLGGRAMGALAYYPADPEYLAGEGVLNLETVAAQAERIVRGSEEEVLAELQVAGGSPGGARPKVAVGYHLKTGELMADQSDLPVGFDRWLVKFHAENDAEDFGLVEFAYAKMAATAGLRMPETRLFAAGDKSYFGVRRFDWQGPKRLHMHTLSGLLHASHWFPSLDYEGFFRATAALTGHHDDVRMAFRYAAFNLFAHNRDDHTKNFSFLMDEHGDWRLSPAYDVVFSSGPGGYHTMDYGGGQLHPTTSDLMRLANIIGIDQPVAKDIIDEVSTATELWPQIATDVGVGRRSREEIRRALQQVMRAANN